MPPSPPLQDPTFVSDVRGRRRDAGGALRHRRRKIFADPRNVLAFAGARGAAGLAKAALRADGMRVFDAGEGQAGGLRHPAPALVAG